LGGSRKALCAGLRSFRVVSMREQLGWKTLVS
jgi:hypothetical protein